MKTKQQELHELHFNDEQVKAVLKRLSDQTLKERDENEAQLPRGTSLEQLQEAAAEFGYSPEAVAEAAMAQIGFEKGQEEDYTRKQKEVGMKKIQKMKDREENRIRRKIKRNIIKDEILSFVQRVINGLLYGIFIMFVFLLLPVFIMMLTPVSYHFWILMVYIFVFGGFGLYIEFYKK